MLHYLADILNEVKGHRTIRQSLGFHLLLRESLAALDVGYQLGTQLLSPFLFLHLTRHLCNFHTLGLTAQEDASPPPYTGQHGKDVEQQGPAGTPEGSGDGDIEHALVLAEGAVIVQHTYPQHVVAITQRHETDVGVQLRGLHPVLVEALQHIDQARTVVDFTAAAAQLHGEGIAVAQLQPAALVQRFFQDDAPVHLLAYRHFAVEQLQSAEQRNLLRAALAQVTGVQRV